LLLEQTEQEGGSQRDRYDEYGAHHLSSAKRPMSRDRFFSNSL
jgi:hypothetical protein